MKPLLKLIILSFFVLLIQVKGYSQAVFEWRINNIVFNSTDPDGAGPATGSVTLTMQLHTKNNGAVIPITAMSTGFCWQTLNAMLPSGVPCGSSIPQTSNITMGAIFTGYTFNNINHCSGSVNFSTGGQSFDRRVVGTIDGGSAVNITNTWIDVFTATLWTLKSTSPQGGYAVLNSTFAGTPGNFSNYDISDVNANAFDANSLTFVTAAPLGSSLLPVTYSNFTANCNDKGALLNWATAAEINTDYFEIQRSKDGNDWYTVNKVKAKGYSATETRYEQYDLLGGAAYYRIKQVDINGVFTYSTINKTNCDSRNVNVVIYPVPAKDILNVLIRSDKAIKTQMEIYNATGKLLRKVNTVITPGTNSFSININGLESGQYFIRSTDTTLQLNKKFTIMQ